MLTWQLKRFEDFSAKELFEVLKLRQEVFVVEQECPYPDIDDIDLFALHLIGKVENEENPSTSAYARLMKPGLNSNYASIGRVVIASSLRGKDCGRTLMQKAIDETKAHYPDGPIKIGAQQYLESFYQSLGFVTHSDMYLEDGIPHIDMLLAPPN